MENESMKNRITKNLVTSSRPMFDRLESRVLLSGNVTASVRGGNLIISGDSSANAIVMDQVGLNANQVRVSSGANATTINGSANSVIFSSVKDVRIALNAGDDNVVSNNLNVRSMLIRGGKGSNTLFVNGATIGTTLHITNAGVGTTTIADATIGKNLLINGTGLQNVSLRRVTVDNTTNIITKNAADAIQIDDSTFGHSVLMNTGSGTDSIQIETQGASDGTASVFEGPLTIVQGRGDDTLQVGISGETGNTATFNKRVHFNGGRGNDTLTYAAFANLPHHSIVSYEIVNTVAVVNADSGINLRSANPFAILAGSGVTNTGGTIINGDLGTSPTATITGAPTVNGQIHAADPIAAQAEIDLTTAFNEARDRAGTPTISLPGELSGLTLAPGIYKNATSTMLSSGSVTLDAQGDPNAVFIFQMGSTLTTLSGTQVILAGGAKAANIYWQVGSSATLGTNSIFRGNILADQSITLTTGAAMEGRALARIGAVALDSNNVTLPTV
jgi:hypothetical protein